MKYFKLVGVGLALTLLLYLVTLNSGVWGQSGMNFENRVSRSFSIGSIGGVKVDREYLAGLPFESEYLYNFKGDGCPCDGVSKFIIISKMMITAEFVANVLFWSISVIAVVFLKKKYENIRD